MSPQRRFISGNRMRSSVAKIPFGTSIQIQSFFREIFGVNWNKSWQYSRRAVTSVGSSKFFAANKSLILSIVLRLNSKSKTVKGLACCK